MKEQKRKYNIWTIGCQMNEADSRHLASSLEDLGYAPTAQADNADLIVLNTCVVRSSAEDKVAGKLRYLQGLKKHKPDIKIALMGCFVGRGRNQDRLREQYPFVDIFMPPSDLSPLKEHLSEFLVDDKAEQDLEAELTEFYSLPSTDENPVSANVPAVLGCSHACTYCIIPYRRGKEHSRPKDEVLQEARHLAQQGVKEIVLLGQIIDRYGVDFQEDYDMADLLRDTAAIDGVHRIRFLTSHPEFITPKIISAVAEETKVCPHFELPCQSGNNAILQEMRRGYTREDFRGLVERIRESIPAAAINTDIIVGFPGETDAQFQDSCRLLKEVRFDTVHIAKYSPRPQTYAARHLADDVPPDVKEQRRIELDNIHKQILGEKNRELLGKNVEVLVESFDARHSRWRGRTPQNKLVFIDSEDDLLAKTVSATVTWTGPFSMLAKYP